MPNVKDFSRTFVKTEVQILWITGSQWRWSYGCPKEPAKDAWGNLIFSVNSWMILKESYILVSTEGKTCLSYLTGIFYMLCSLNKELQGSDKNTYWCISVLSDNLVPKHFFRWFQCISLAWKSCLLSRSDNGSMTIIADHLDKDFKTGS